MATELLYASAHYAGSFANPANATGNTPTTWAGNLNAVETYSSTWNMGDPSGALTPSATQTIRIVARKGSNSGTPSISISLYEGGVSVRQILALTDITSTTGQTLTATFNSSEVSDPANVQIYVGEVGVGGNANTRNCAQISHIEWTADVADPATVERTGSLSGVSTLTADGQQVDPPQTLERTGTIVGTSSLTATIEAPPIPTLKVWNGSAWVNAVVKHGTSLPEVRLNTA